MEKLKAENPNYLYIICHGYHVTIIVQKLLTSSHAHPQLLHTIKLDLAKHMLQSLPPDSLPLYCVINVVKWLINNFEPPALYCTILMGFSTYLCVENSNSIVTTDS